MSINDNSGIIEFYNHAIPYLASTRLKVSNNDLIKNNDGTVSIEFAGLINQSNSSSEKFFSEGYYRGPRGPDRE